MIIIVRENIDLLVLRELQKYCNKPGEVDFFQSYFFLSVESGQFMQPITLRAISWPWNIGGRYVQMQHHGIGSDMYRCLYQIHECDNYVDNFLSTQVFSAIMVCLCTG